MTANTVKKYMQYVTEIEERAEGRRRLYHIGDRFCVEVFTCQHDERNPHDLANIWKNNGYISAFLPTTFHVDTYYTDEAGNCWGKFNITVKPSEDGRRQVINFDYLKEATKENELELVAECVRLYIKATRKSEKGAG